MQSWIVESNTKPILFEKNSNRDFFGLGINSPITQLSYSASFANSNKDNCVKLLTNNLLDCLSNLLSHTFAADIVYMVIKHIL